MSFDKISALLQKFNHIISAERAWEPGCFGALLVTSSLELTSTNQGTFDWAFSGFWIFVWFRFYHKWMRLLMQWKYTRRINQQYNSESSYDKTFLLLDIYSSTPGSRFSKVPKSFRSRKAVAKSLFYSHIFNMARGPIHTRSFRRIHLSVFRKRLCASEQLPGRSRNGPLESIGCPERHKKSSARFSNESRTLTLNSRK